MKFFFTSASPGLIKYFLLYYRGNDSETTARLKGIDGRAMPLCSHIGPSSLPRQPPHVPGVPCVLCGPQISDVIQSLKSAERKWITLSTQLPVFVLFSGWPNILVEKYALLLRSFLPSGRQRWAMCGIIILS